MKFVKLFAKKLRLWLTTTLVVGLTVAHAQTTPSDAQSKTKFADKIGHWLYAYGMSSPDFLPEDRATFKERAFAEVYVEATINYDAWMFNLLNKVTKFRYPAKQMPHIIFEVKFTPTDATLTKYNIAFAIQATSEVSVNLQNIANEAAAPLSGKTYTEPALAVEDIEKAIKAALTTLANRLGDELAPNLLVRYANEVFWDGHEIPVMEGEGNYVELEAVDKSGSPINSSLLTWTNADPFVSKGVVDMTGVNSKEVTLVKTDEPNSPLRVTLKRVGTSDDINELLKMLIVEVLTQKKQEATGELSGLRQDSLQNADLLVEKIKALEAGNFILTNGPKFSPVLQQPAILTDTADFREGNKKEAFSALRKHKRLRTVIQRKLNAVALADLVVDKPEKIQDLLEDLLSNSGRLIARLVMNTDRDRLRSDAKNIVIDYFNQNLERIAGNLIPAQNPRPLLPPIPANSSSPLRFESGRFVYVSNMVRFEGLDALISDLDAHLRTLATPTIVIINYSQDITTQNFIDRTVHTRPAGLPEGYDYIVYTYLNIPGSVEGTFTVVDSYGNSSNANTSGKSFRDLLKDDAFERTSAGARFFEEIVSNEGSTAATLAAPCSKSVLMPFNEVVQFTDSQFAQVDEWSFDNNRLQHFTIDGKKYTRVLSVKVKEQKYEGVESTYEFADWISIKADAAKPDTETKQIRKVEIADATGQTHTVYQGLTNSSFVIKLAKVDCVIGAPVYVNSQNCYFLTLPDCQTEDNTPANNNGNQPSTFVDHSQGADGRSPLTVLEMSNIRNHVTSINSAFGIESKIFLLNKENPNFEQHQSEANADGSKNKGIVVLEKDASGQIKVNLQFPFKLPTWFTDMFPTSSADPCTTGYVNDGLTTLHNSDLYKRSLLPEKIVSEYLVVIYRTIFGSLYCATSEEAVANRSDVIKFLGGAFHEVIASIDIADIISGLITVAKAAVTAEFDSYKEYVSDIRRTFIEIKQGQTISYQELFKRSLPPMVRRQIAAFDAILKIGDHLVKFYFTECGTICPYRYGQFTVMVIPIVLTAGEWAVIKAGKIISNVRQFNNLSKANEVAGLIVDAQKSGKTIINEGSDILVKESENSSELLISIEKRGDDVTVNRPEDVREITNSVAKTGEDFTILENARKLPGSASGNGNVISGKWLRGTEGNAGLFPKSVADKLKGRQFRTFDEFRQAFWKEVANDANLASQFDPQQVSRMQEGMAPFAKSSQHLVGPKGAQRNYILHHKTPINRGGSVYDMDNLYIVTPKFHKEILDPAYHYGYGY